MSANFAVYQPDNVLLYNPIPTLSGLPFNIDVKVAWGEKAHPYLYIPLWIFWDLVDSVLQYYNFNPWIDDEEYIESARSANGIVQTRISTDQIPILQFDGVEPVRIIFSGVNNNVKWTYTYEYEDFPSLNSKSNFWSTIPIIQEGYPVQNVLLHVYVADNARNFTNGTNGAKPLKGSSLIFEFNYLPNYGQTITG
jgi:hypothetical protein